MPFFFSREKRNAPKGFFCAGERFRDTIGVVRFASNLARTNVQGCSLRLECFFSLSSRDLERGKSWSSLESGERGRMTSQGRSGKVLSLSHGGLTGHAIERRVWQLVNKQR